MWTLAKLVLHRPKVVHTCDLDTFLPSYIYKILFRKLLVFDVFDRYAMAFIPPRFETLYSLVNSLEEVSAKRSDVLITVSDKLLETFGRKPKHCYIILNCSEEHAISNRDRELTQLKIAFTGHVGPRRGLEEVVSVVKDLDNVELLITGVVGDKKILHEIQGVRNVRYLGLLPPDDFVTMQASSDVIIALYNTYQVHNLGETLPVGNKIFDAMMYGIPIITNMAPGFISEIGCGIVVEYGNVNQIRSAIVMLRDDIQLRTSLGNNARKAFLQKYNWKAMEQKIYEIYDRLLFR